MCEDKYTLQDLYRALKKYDADILKHFNDSSLTDKDYLLHAINSDIVSNAIHIVINLLYNNKHSVGIDNDIRAIIEGFTILKMLNSGDISPEQQKIFRNHYAIVEYQNFKQAIQKSKESQTQDLKKAYDEAIQYILNYHHCTKTALKQALPKPESPLFYLKKNLNDDIRFCELTERYKVFGESTNNMYSLFSVLAHPCYLSPENLYDDTMRIRDNYIKYTLDYLVNYLREIDKYVVDDSVSSFDDDFTNNPKLQKNIANMRSLVFVFAYLKQDLCTLKEGTEQFQTYYFDFAFGLIIDMLLCESLGFGEQVISKFKPFIEHSSIFAEINSADSVEKYRMLKMMYKASSFLQLNEVLISMGLSKEASPDEILSKYYNEYYEKEYGINTFEEFKNGIKSDSFYFLDPAAERNSYNKFVQKSINNLFADERMSDQLKEAFKLSNDMNHASGYNFNSSPIVSEYFEHLVIHSVMLWMANLCLHASLCISENDHETNIGTAFETLVAIANAERQAMVDIGEKYKKIMKPKKKK